MEDLERFVDAQANSYHMAIAELRAGRKRSHWMWWIFPQIRGLGHSDAARFYAIDSLAEARAYLAHPLLGPRLVEATSTAMAAPGDAEAIFGSVDALKLRSSMTLFAMAGDAVPMIGATPFRAALDRFFGGERDAATVVRL